ncbi:MAG: ABC transporter substrate-binding protein [Deltaproteobacteria bacterium]|nr:ABC transporter substrate-binding protein [Deltaproteobacteria bacterium]
MYKYSAILLFYLIYNISFVYAAVRPVLIAFDGEYGLQNSTSAQMIEKGLRIAIKEINDQGGVLNGRQLGLITKDNRSVPARGIQNVKEFAENKDVVAVVGGRFSPVILSVIPIVHEEKIILMDAWGSADKITDHDYQPSFTFRVSLRDKYAMPTMIKHAISKGGKKIGLLLPNTGWGRSNQKAARKYIKESKSDIQLKEIWYNWGDKDFITAYETFLQWGAESLLMVANDIEGSLVVRLAASYPEKKILPIISHWGVTGGYFVEACQGSLDKIDFSVVQTFSLFKADPAIRAKVMKYAGEMFGIKDIKDIQSPVGFGHAYDIVHLLAKAIEAAGSSDRSKVREALEEVSDYRGLVKYYKKPFSPTDHNALEMSDVFMAVFDKQGVLKPIETRK